MTKKTGERQPVMNLAIVYVHVRGEPQFLANLTEWQIDPQFKDANFAIKLPQDAKEISVNQMTQ